MDIEAAILANDASAVSAAISAGADPNAPLSNRLRPLRFAAGRSADAAVLALLDGGANPALLGEGESTKLGLYCFASTALIPLLRQRGLDPNAPPDWTSPIAHACKALQPGDALAERLSALLDAGADPKAPGVLWAALTGRNGQPVPLEILDGLLDAGADASEVPLSAPPHYSSSGSALHYALQAHALKHARRLLRHGAPVSDPALLYLLQGWPLAQVKDLAESVVRAVGSVDARAYASSLTALGRAARPDRLDWLEWLLAQGADPNLAHTNGETALSAAVREGDQGVVLRLLQAGAKPDSARLDGTDLLSWLGGARAKREMVRLLKEHGATPPARSKTVRATEVPPAEDAPAGVPDPWTEILECNQPRQQVAEVIELMESHGLSCVPAVKASVAQARAFDKVTKSLLGATAREFGGRFDGQRLMLLLVPTRCVVVDCESLDCGSGEEPGRIYRRLLSELAKAGNWKLAKLRWEASGQTATLSFVAFDTEHSWTIDLAARGTDDNLFVQIDAMLAAHAPEQRIWVFQDDYTQTVVTAPATLVEVWRRS